MKTDRDLGIAVVIPVYNLENYVEAAIRSIVQQPYKNIWVICVDDGSTDSSVDVIQQIICEDSRVTLLQQENKGVSVARNQGIEYVLKNMSAEYIMFLDGDDVWCKDWLDADVVKILNQKYDTVCFDACSVNHSLTFRTPYEHPYTGVVCGGNAAVDVNHTMWQATAYRAELLKEYSVRFHEGQRYGEDLCFLLETRSLSKECCFVEKLIYLYRDRPGSAVRRHIPAVVYFPTLFDGWFRSYEKLKDDGIISKSALKKINWYIPDMVECHYRDGGSTAQLSAVLQKYIDRLEQEGFCEEKTRNWKKQISCTYIVKQRCIGVAIRLSKWLRCIPAYRKIKERKRYPIPMEY